MLKDCSPSRVECLFPLAYPLVAKNTCHQASFAVVHVCPGTRWIKLLIGRCSTGAGSFFSGGAANIFSNNLLINLGNSYLHPTKPLPMQATLLGNMTVHCDAITAIHPAIVFDCVVEEKRLKATLTHQEDNGIHFIYHISFSDGYTAAFVASMESDKWLDDAPFSKYALAIKDDLNAICGFLPKKPPFCIRLKNEKGEAFNVWIVPHVYKSCHYSIYYRGDYRFDVRKANTWEVRSVRDNRNINQEIAAMVCKNIDQRMLLTLFEEQPLT